MRFSTSPRHSPRRFPRRASATAAAALLLWTLAGRAASGQEENPELEFAQRLVERGWAVVAEPLIERSLKGSAPADKDRFLLLRAQLLLQTARETSGVRPRAEAFKNAFATIEELIPAGKKPKTDGPQGGELGDFLISSASLLGETARRETDTAQAAELRKYALRMLDTASGIFRARVEAARQTGAGNSQEEEEEGETSSVSRDEMSSAYNLARAGFERGLLLEDKKEKQAALVESRKAFEDFQATFAETPLAFEAAIFIGRSWTELENQVKAMEAFEGAASLTNLFKDEDGKQGPVDHPLAADIIQRALYLKAQAANRCQKPAEAKEAVFRALKLFPRIQRTPIGWALRLELAESLLRQKKVPDASRVAQEVEKEDREGPWGARAREFLAKIIGTGDTTAALKAIEELIAQNKINEAIRACHRVLSPLDLSEKQAADTAAPFSLLMGKAYTQSERHHEAAIVYEELVERSPEHKYAPESLFEAMKARLLINSKSPSSLDEARYEANRKKLTANYPNSPQAAAAKYLEGDEALEAGKYDEAKKLYLEVPEAAGRYRDNALHQAGVTMWMLGYRGKTAAERKRGFAEAEKLFLDCLTIYTREQPGLDPERVQNRAKLLFATRVKLADIYSSPTIKKHQQALEQIEKAEGEETTTAEKVLTVSLKLSRARALAGLGRLDDALQALVVVRSEDPDNRSLPFLCHDIGLAFDNRAQGKGERAGKEYRDDLIKALEHYALWLDDSKRFKLRLSPKLATDTADRALAIALEVSELPEKKDSFTDALDRVVSNSPGGATGARKGSKPLPRAEWERAARLLEEARPKRTAGQTTDWLPLVKLGRAYGFLGEWAKARDNLEEALVWGGFLASTGEASPAPRLEALNKAPDLLEIFIDLGFTELLPAKKGGLARAQGIFQKAFDQTQRESCAWWKCRYGYIAAEVKDGNYDRAQAQLNIVRQTFPEWDQDACGLKDRFEELKNELEAKMPSAPGK